MEDEREHITPENEALLAGDVWAEESTMPTCPGCGAAVLPGIARCGACGMLQPICVGACGACITRVCVRSNMRR